MLFLLCVFLSQRDEERLLRQLFALLRAGQLQEVSKYQNTLLLACLVHSALVFGFVGYSFGIF